MLEYLNENEGRAYPFVDSSIIGLPDDLVTDMVIAGPAEDLEGAFLSSIVKRGTLISVAIASPVGGLTVVTVASPEQGKPYELSQVRTGVGGFITFGDGVTEQTELNLVGIELPVDPGCLRPTRVAGVASVGKLGVQKSASLTGVVSLRVSPNMTVSHTDNTIFIGLTPEAREDFVAKCDRRAIFDECGEPPVRRIAGVGCDENGKITLEFDNG